MAKFGTELKAQLRSMGPQAAGIAAGAGAAYFYLSPKLEEWIYKQTTNEEKPDSKGFEYADVAAPAAIAAGGMILATKIKPKKGTGAQVLRGVIAGLIGGGIGRAAVAVAARNGYDEVIPFLTHGDSGFIEIRPSLQETRAAGRAISMQGDGGTPATLPRRNPLGMAV